MSSNLIIQNGLIILPDSLMIEKEKSILLYPLDEENKELINDFCLEFSKGKKSKTSACDKVGISPTTINRILKYAKKAQEYCDENDIKILNTNYKHVYKAAKKIRTATAKATENLESSISKMSEEGNFQAAKWLISQINPEAYPTEQYANQMNNLNNVNVSNTENVEIKLNILSIDDNGKKIMQQDQSTLFDLAKKLKLKDERGNNE